MVVVVVLGVAAVLVPSGAGASKPPWSGNPAAIAYYRQAVAKTNALPALQDVYHRYYWLYDDASVTGAKGAFDLAWGYPKRPASYYVAATGTDLVRMVKGKSSWYTLTVAPSCGGGICVSSAEPLEILVTKGGDFWGYVRSGTQAACWNHATGNSAWINKDYKSGSAWWSTTGYYRPIVHQGNQVLITSIYPNSDKATITETDSINATTKLFTGSKYKVSASPNHAYPAHSYSITETDPKAAPHAPKVHLCS
jgi:hypothetical protein